MIENKLKNDLDLEKLNSNHKTPILPQYLVDRQVLTQELVIKESGYGARDKSVLYALKDFWNSIHICGIILQLVPILQWLPKYPIKKYIIGDIFAGITVAVMHIPQGMAYGILAGVTANVGLNMAFFPTLMYVALGTSRHISMGTFAVISLMTLKVVQTHATTDAVIEAGEAANGIYTPMQVVTATAVTVGFIHLIMGALRLGTLATLLSEPLVNGFTTAAAVHVICSQLKDVLGVSIPKHKGPFKIVYTLIELGNSVEKTNITSLLFSLGIILFMIIMNEFIKPWLGKRCRFPLPAELIAVVGGTLISRYANFGALNVKMIGNLPVGLPAPQFPPTELFSLVLVDAIAIAIVSYSVVMSMSFTFAKKHSYEVSANQELFALGISNIFGGTFSCIPLSCSLSRSLIQEQTGGMTQIASVVSALLILTILLWIGPFFETLPKCVLAGVIIVALKGMFMQAKKLKTFAKQGKLEVLTWLCSFLGVILIDIDIGLFLGICVSFLALYIKGWKPSSALLGTLPSSAIYVDLENHKKAVPVPNTKIFRYTGSLNFATRSTYKKDLYTAIEIDHRKIRRASYVVQMNGESKMLNFSILIIDLSSTCHMDTAGCNTLTEISKELKILGIRMYLASPQDRVYDTLVHSMSLGEGPFNVLPTIHDAVLFAKSNPLS